MAQVEFTSLHVLVIDDEEFVRNMMGRLLETIGVGQVSFAEDGNLAFEVLKSSGSKIDLILCDLEMPEIDGFEFVRRLRVGEEERYRDVPVLIVTSHSDEGSIHSAVDLGIQGYVTKPASRTILENQIASALQAPPHRPR